LSDSTRISTTFSELRSRGHMAFMPFVTSGDPSMQATVSLIRELARSGVDLIEVGFPYSDPIADGPVIQASYTRALDQHIQVADIFEGIASLRDDAAIPPLVAMVSYAIIFRRGPESFVDQAAIAGFSGFIVPDLPADEADSLAQVVRSRNLDLIQLMAPTTPPDRTQRILDASTGFVYCISVAGTTGVRDRLPVELTEQLSWLRARTKLPLAVGFGISRPEQVDTLRGLADGIIVGSAIVRQMEALAADTAATDRVIAEIGQFASAMVQATRN